MFNVNEYFNGNVKSLALENSEGKATIGVMAPGEYEFGTATVEIMKVITGKLTVQLPDADKWEDFHAGESFEVDKDKKFKVKIEEQSAYLCLYK